MSFKLLAISCLHFYCRDVQNTDIKLVMNRLSCIQFNVPFNIMASVEKMPVLKGSKFRAFKRLWGINRKYFRRMYLW